MPMLKNKAPINDSLAQYRLFQLMSPSLPIGGFTYSQGLEWAVEAQWVNSQQSLVDWLVVVLEQSITTLELPLLCRYYQAVTGGDIKAIERWNDYFYSCRETKELRAEERQRGQALFTLLKQLDVLQSVPLQYQLTHTNQLLGLAIAAVYWHIPLDKLLQGYMWSWAENMVMAGVKLVPLGQTAGQRTLLLLTDHFPLALQQAEKIKDDDIGSYLPAGAIASSRHETQYTRLFRS